jgi:hypothetical protein
MEVAVRQAWQVQVLAYFEPQGGVVELVARELAVMAYQWAAACQEAVVMANPEQGVQA